MCAPGVTDTANCRLMTDAEVVTVDCPKRNPQAKAVCTIELRVLGIKHFGQFSRERVRQLSPGAHLPVEIFRSSTTGAEFHGQFVLRSGSPQEAMRTLKLIFPVWGVLGSISALYLYWLRRQKKQ